MLSLLTELVKNIGKKVIFSTFFLMVFITCTMPCSINENILCREHELDNEIFSNFQEIIDVDEFEFSDYIGVPLNSRVDLACELNGNYFKFGRLTERVSPYELITYYQGIVEVIIYNNNYTPLKLPYSMYIGMDKYALERQLQQYGYKSMLATDELEIDEITICKDIEYSIQKELNCNIHIEMKLEFTDNTLNKIHIILSPNYACE